jgi:hypothetical protein
MAAKSKRDVRTGSGSHHDGIVTVPDATNWKPTSGPKVDWPVVVRRIYPSIPEAIAVLFSHGKLEQVCPNCGLEEAASWYCSRCLRESVPAEWRTWADIHPERAAALRARQPAGGFGRKAATVAESV